MTPPDLLTPAQLAKALTTVPGWVLAADGLSIERQWRFTGFMEALAFLQALAPLAEAQNHHPEVLWIYNRVTLTLTTHDASGLTQRDITLASALNHL